VHNRSIRYFDRFGLFADEFETSWDPVFPHHSILSFDDIHHGFAGTFQGGVDFLTHQIAGIGSLCCAIGANEWEDPEDRLFSTLAFAESTAGHLHHFDNWMTNILHVDSNHSLYQQHRAVAATALEIGSLAVGGYELAKGAMGLARFARFSQQAEITGSLASGELQFARQSFVSTLESRIGQLKVPNGGVPRSLDLDALSRAGQVMDRGGLTRAGRALDKHGNRFGSPFPRATGRPTSKNTQGLFHLDDILTHPNSRIIDYGEKGFEIYTPDGRGIHFRADGRFRGFVE